jgi:tetrahydromethanopterin S-methyltransferase subunit G
MSDLEKELLARAERLEAKLEAEATKVRRSLGGRLGRGLGLGVIGLLLLMAGLFAAFAWYSTTDDFGRRVRGEVV